MTLCPEIINFIRLHLLHYANKVTGVRQITVMQFKIDIINMWILINMINSLRIKRTRSSFNSMNSITFTKKKFSKVRSILTSHPCNKRCFFIVHH